MAIQMLSAFVPEVTTSVTSFLSSRITTIRKFNANINALRRDMTKLMKKKNDMKEDIELARREGKRPTAQLEEWLKEVEEIEHEVNLLLEKVLNEETVAHRCSLRFTLHYKLSNRARKKLEVVKQLITSGNFPTQFMDGNSPIKAIEPMLTHSIEGQKAASELLQQLLNLLNGDETERIAVWGMGGVGKTTLVRNLNNKLECSSLAKPFDIVIWVPVSKYLDLRRVQSQIAERLNLNMKVEESTERRASRLLQRLKREKRFLLILDDVWEKVDLDIVGIPRGDNHQGCQIILTTRSLDVCREMKTDKEIKVDVLSEEEAWRLFVQNAGKVVELEGIGSLARAITRECGGLPLAIKAVGTSMRGKSKIELWKNALNELQSSEPYTPRIQKEVFWPLKWSYDLLQGEIIKRCFLYCSLYPEGFSIKITELIRDWVADGLIDEQRNLEESLNKGHALVEKLKDSCMLEHGEHVGTVKMHDVVRDVSIWIASSLKEEREFLIQSGLALCEMPEKMQKSLKRVSFMNNKIAKLPGRLMGCSDLLTLFLQGNPLKKIPDGFFREVRALRVLNLSGTSLTSLPTSLLELVELRALLLRDCCSLEKLPSLGVPKKLQVLDLLGTRIRELPKEIGELSNLRELNLSHTNYLEIIQAGIISRLSSLEALDMSFSAYKWDVKEEVDDGRATFGELVSLSHLSYLCIRLDTVACLAVDFALWKRLKTFNIHINPRSCDLNYLPTQHGERRVILSSVDLLERGMRGLLSNASALVLDTCGGISGLCEIAANRSMSDFVGLRSLSISGCEEIINLIRGEDAGRGVLPNLDELTLKNLKNLERFLDGMVRHRGFFSRLRTIEVVNCPRLKNLISYALLQRLQNLEEIKVSSCEGMKCIIAATVLDEDTLPKLKVLKLNNLIKLKTICRRTMAWPSLEQIEVSNCPMLEKLPFSAHNAGTLTEIRGDIRWWNRLRWKDDEIKSTVQQHFQACTYEQGWQQQRYGYEEL